MVFDFFFFGCQYSVPLCQWHPDLLFPNEIFLVCSIDMIEIQVLGLLLQKKANKLLGSSFQKLSLTFPSIIESEVGDLNMANQLLSWDPDSWMN